MFERSTFPLVASCITVGCCSKELRCVLLLAAVVARNNRSNRVHLHTNQDVMGDYVNDSDLMQHSTQRLEMEEKIPQQRNMNENCDGIEIASNEKQRNRRMERARERVG